MSGRASKGQGPAATVSFDDPALGEALAQAAAFGRLSDDDIRAMRMARRRNIASGVSAALVLVAGLGAWRFADMGQGAAPALHYETQRGQRLAVNLPDGSHLQLDGATSLDVTMDKDERRAVLRRGEAYFDIAHEAQRPFRVEARGSVTQVLGTAFDINVAHRDVKLAVYRGAVRFGGSEAGVIVHAGWRSRFTDGMASAPTRFDAAQQEWRQDWLDTDNMRLGDLVDTLNRRGGPLIEAPSADLADLMLSGRFKLDSSEQLLGAIGSAYGFTLIHDGPTLRLVPAAESAAKLSSE